MTKRLNLLIHVFAFCVTATFFNIQLLGVVAFAQSNETFKRCGKAGGGTNASCPACVGTCEMVTGKGGKTHSYKVCEGDGDDCTMPDKSNAFCSGWILDGGADGKGCDGTTGGTCQVNITKCNT